MSYVRLTDVQTQAETFFVQATARQLRDNQDDHESRISQLLAQSANGHVDDFLAAHEGGSDGLDLAIYDVAGAGATFRPQVGVDGSHVLKVATVATAATKSIRALNTKCAFRLNQDMAGFFEARFKDVGGAAPDNLVIGLQDRSAATLATDESDIIAFLKGTTAGKWRFRVAKGGVATTTDNIGNRATWQKLRLEWLRSGGGSTFQVRAFIDGSEISGSPFTTNLPDTVILSPTFACLTPAAGTTDAELDRWEWRWTSVPVAA
jgi:hypothetical protein